MYSINLLNRMDELKEIQKKMEQTDTNEISLTDPEARLMKTRTGIDVCAWTRKRNRDRKRINWGFDRKKADKKLSKYYTAL